jgi:transposase
LNFSVTGGQVHDSQVLEQVLNTPRSPLVVTADKAYDSQTARQQIKDEGALPIIPNRRNAIKQAYCPKRFYRQRHKIENFFCRIKDWRRIATRYDKLARNFLAAATLNRRTLLDQAVSPDPSHRFSAAEMDMHPAIRKHR